MKRSFTFIIILFNTLNCFGTDILIVGKDTFYLKTYPLEALHLKQRPFGSEIHNVEASNLYPGYLAVWRIIDGKLYLDKITSVNGEIKQEENINELMERNDIQYQSNGKLILANWFSIIYYPMEPYSPDRGYYILLGGSFDENYDASRALLRFEKGFVTFNNLPKHEK